MNNPKQSQQLKLDQVFLGIAVGVLLASMIISVITFYAVSEINQTTRDTLDAIKRNIEQLDTQPVDEETFQE